MNNVTECSFILCYYHYLWPRIGLNVRLEDEDRRVWLFQLRLLVDLRWDVLFIAERAAEVQCQRAVLLPDLVPRPHDIIPAVFG